jgi:hypothetical protein
VEVDVGRCSTGNVRDHRGVCIRFATSVGNTAVDDSRPLRTSRVASVCELCMYEWTKREQQQQHWLGPPPPRLSARPLSTAEIAGDLPDVAARWQRWRWHRRRELPQHPTRHSRRQEVEAEPWAFSVSAPSESRPTLFVLLSHVTLIEAVPFQRGGTFGSFPGSQ